MQTRKINRKAHQVSTVLIVIAMIISVFSIGFYTEGNGNKQEKSLKTITVRKVVNK